MNSIDQWLKVLVVETLQFYTSWCGEFLARTASQDMLSYDVGCRRDSEWLDMDCIGTAQYSIAYTIMQHQ